MNPPVLASCLPCDVHGVADIESTQTPTYSLRVLSQPVNPVPLNGKSVPVTLARSHSPPQTAVVSSTACIATGSGPSKLVAVTSQ